MINRVIKTKQNYKVLVPGELFGEYEVFSNLKLRTQSVITNSESNNLFFIKKDFFLRILEEDRELYN